MAESNLIKMIKYIVDIFDGDSTTKKCITIENILEILKYAEQYFIHKYLWNKYDVDRQNIRTLKIIYQA